MTADEFAYWLDGLVRQPGDPLAKAQIVLRKVREMNPVKAAVPMLVPPAMLPMTVRAQCMHGREREKRCLDCEGLTGGDGVRLFVFALPDETKVVYMAKGEADPLTPKDAS